jgi:hypothetical protein
VLLNGGVFNAPAMVERLMEVLAGWYGEPVARLEHTSLDLAVAHGAVRSALARRGIGEAITGGTARAYYIGIEGPAGERKALRVAPRGLESGASATVPDRIFELVLDQPVAFPLFAYTGDRVDAPGAIVDIEEELEPLPPLETLMRDSTSSAATMPVTISTTLTEMGALEISLLTVDLPPRRYRLDFTLRREAPTAAATSEPTIAKPDPELATSLGLPPKGVQQRGGGDRNPLNAFARVGKFFWQQVTRIR